MLQTLRGEDDQLVRSVTSVELLLDGKKLLENSTTLADSGLSSTDPALLAVFSSGMVTCGRKEEAPYKLNRADTQVVLTIPDGTCSIAERAFDGCSSLQGVTLPSSLTRIEAWAFSGCSSLTSISIPSSVTFIGYEAFRDCRSITSLTIPDSVTSIGHRAFSSCISLASLTLPNSITSVGPEVFRGCISLSSLTIPNSVRVIDDWAFARCRSLRTLYIPDSVQTIGSGAFRYSQSLTSLTIPRSVSVERIFPDRPSECEIVWLCEKGCLRQPCKGHLLRIPSSQTWWWGCARVRSRPEPRADPRGVLASRDGLLSILDVLGLIRVEVWGNGASAGCPSTTSSCELRRSWVTGQNVDACVTYQANFKCAEGVIVPICAEKFLLVSHLAGPTPNTNGNFGVPQAW